MRPDVKPKCDVASRGGGADVPPPKTLAAECGTSQFLWKHENTLVRFVVRAAPRIWQATCSPVRWRFF
jgi:hypothetical protein